MTCLNGCVDALDRAAQQVRGLHVVVDNVAASITANPAMPAAEVLARVRAALPDIPSFASAVRDATR